MAALFLRASEYRLHNSEVPQTENSVNGDGGQTNTYMCRRASDASLTHSLTPNQLRPTSPACRAVPEYLWPLCFVKYIIAFFCKEHIGNKEKTESPGKLVRNSKIALRAAFRDPKLRLVLPVHRPRIPKVDIALQKPHIGPMIRPSFSGRAFPWNMSIPQRPAVE